MSDFWSRALGAPPQPPQQSVPQHNPNLPWWERPIAQVQPLQQVPPAQLQQPQQGMQQPSVDEQQRIQETLRKTQWAKHQKGNCPGCDSENYGVSPETPNARPYCHDCGWPLVQQGSGLKGLNDLGSGQGGPRIPVREARQLTESRTNNYNPRHIFAAPHRES